MLYNYRRLHCALGHRAFAEIHAECKSQKPRKTLSENVGPLSPAVSWISLMCLRGQAGATSAH